MVDMTKVLGALGVGASEASGLQNELRAATSLAKTGITEEGAANQEVVRNQGIIDAQKHAGEMQAQQNARRAATSLGANMDDPSQIITSLGSVAKQAAEQIVKQSQVVNEIAAGSDMFGNPAGFVYDLMYGDAERSKLAGATTAFDATIKAMNSLNQATQQTAITQNAIAETKTTATLAAQQELIAAQAAQQAAKTKQSLAGADMKYIGVMDQLNARQTSIAVQSYQIQAQAEQQAWAREEAVARREERQAAKQGDESLVNAYNAGAAMFNQPQIGSAAALRQQGTLNKDLTSRIITAGSQINAGMKPQIAANPLEALTLADSGHLALNPAQTDVASKFLAASGTALTPDGVAMVLRSQGVSDEPTIKRMSMELLSDKKKRPGLLADFMKLKATADSQLINVGDTANIYGLPTMDFLKDKAFLNTDPFLSEYIKPIVLGGGAALDPNILLTKAVEAANSGKYTTGQIADSLAYIGNQAKLSKNATVNYQGIFGVKPLDKVTMSTTLSVSPMSVGVARAKNIDISDPTSWTARILDGMAAQKLKQDLSVANPFGNIPNLMQ